MKIKAFFYIVLLALCWGPSYLFIKIGIEEFPPITLVAVRLVLAATLCYILCRLRKISLPKDLKTWGHLTVQGFISCGMPFILFGYGELYVDSALAAIINGITPISALICTHLLLSGQEPISRSQIAGITVGLLGFIILLAPTLIGRELVTSAVGILLIAAACLSYGLGMAYTRKYLKGLPPLVGPTTQLITCCLYLVPLACFIDTPWDLPPPSLQGVGAILFLAIFGGAAAFSLYFHILNLAGPIALSTVTYLMPLVGVALGVLIRGESLEPHAYATLSLILVSIALTNKMISLPRPKVSPAPADE